MPQSRLDLFKQFVRYNSSNAIKATKLYDELAKSYQLTATQMALAFVNQQEFVTATIIGATTLHQLQQNITAFNTVLSVEILKEINTIQEVYPNPCP